jgi:hypothetical protein
MEDKVLCKCGRWTETTTILDSFSKRELDCNGVVIYEVCPHGQTVIDLRDEWRNDLDE